MQVAGTHPCTQSRHLGPINTTPVTGTHPLMASATNPCTQKWNTGIECARTGPGAECSRLWGATHPWMHRRTLPSYGRGQSGPGVLAGLWVEPGLEVHLPGGPGCLGQREKELGWGGITRGCSKDKSWLLAGVGGVIGVRGIRERLWPALRGSGTVGGQMEDATGSRMSWWMWLAWGGWGVRAVMGYGPLPSHSLCFPLPRATSESTVEAMHVASRSSPSQPPWGRMGMGAQPIQVTARPDPDQGAGGWRDKIKQQGTEKCDRL